MHNPSPWKGEDLLDFLALICFPQQQPLQSEPIQLKEVLKRLFPSELFLAAIGIDLNPTILQSKHQVFF